MWRAPAGLRWTRAPCGPASSLNDELLVSSKSQEDSFSGKQAHPARLRAKLPAGRLPSEPARPSCSPMDVTNNGSPLGSSALQPAALGAASGAPPRAAAAAGGPAGGAMVQCLLLVCL